MLFNLRIKMKMRVKTKLLILLFVLSVTVLILWWLIRQPPAVEETDQTSAIEIQGFDYDLEGIVEIHLEKVQLRLRYRIEDFANDRAFPDQAILRKLLWARAAEHVQRREEEGSIDKTRWEPWMHLVCNEMIVRFAISGCNLRLLEYDPDRENFRNLPIRSFTCTLGNINGGTYSNTRQQL
jgi:hypothetical protein